MTLLADFRLALWQLGLVKQRNGFANSIPEHISSAHARAWYQTRNPR